MQHTRNCKQPKAKAKASENLYARPSHRAAAAACLCPQCLARRKIWQCITAPAALCHAPSAAPHALCSPSSDRAAAVLLPRRRRTAPAFPRSRRAAPAPLSCCSRAAIVAAGRKESARARNAVGQRPGAPVLTSQVVFVHVEEVSTLKSHLEPACPQGAAVSC